MPELSETPKDKSNLHKKCRSVTDELHFPQLQSPGPENVTIEGFRKQIIDLKHEHDMQLKSVNFEAEKTILEL